MRRQALLVLIAGLLIAADAPKDDATTKDLKAVTGTLSFDDKRNPQKEAVILKIYPDHFAFFKRVKP